MNYVYTGHAKERLCERFPGLSPDTIERARPRLITSESVIFADPATGAEFVTVWNKDEQLFVIVTVQGNSKQRYKANYRKTRCIKRGREPERRKRRWHVDGQP